MSYIAIVDRPEENRDEENIGEYIQPIKDYVPILAPSADILPRLKTLAAHFTSKYNVEPSFFVRVPGRVNLIGEHIDYWRYSVLPMAIEQNILIAVATSKDNEIHLTNVDPKYKDFRCSFENVESCISDSESGSVWYKYFLCGVKGALEVIPARSVPTGILAAVWGNIPPNSGLSSSSALVSAALLSVIHASQFFVLRRQLSKRDLATLSARAERHIGTQGNGMDQAITFLAKAGKAKLIEFRSDFPLRATDVTLTDNAVFVIAHSQAYHNKASTTDYNLRVAECRLTAQICESLGVDYEQLKERTPLVSSFNSSKTFKQQRARHVHQEARRVRAFCRINKEHHYDTRLQKLGNLMSESHTSLHKLYECSHPSVDALVERAMLCGAFGARLTGWGGCIVALIDKNRVQQFVEDLREYLCQNSTKDRAELEDMVFPTSPNHGAVIYTVPTL